jgi:hypothetical protein
MGNEIFSKRSPDERSNIRGFSFAVIPHIVAHLDHI